MDSLPDVEPCPVPESTEIEFITGVPCAFDQEHQAVHSRECDSVHTTGLCTAFPTADSVPSPASLLESPSAFCLSNHLVIPVDPFQMWFLPTAVQRPFLSAIFLLLAVVVPLQGSGFASTSLCNFGSLHLLR